MGTDEHVQNERPYIADNYSLSTTIINNNNFDDELDATWQKTECQIDKLTNMNRRFQSKYDHKTTTVHLPQIPILKSKEDKCIQVDIPICCSHCKQRMDDRIDNFEQMNEENMNLQMEMHTTTSTMRKEIVTTSTSSSMEMKSVISELDRKKFIMDLKNMDVDTKQCVKRKRTKKNSLRDKVNNLKMSMQIGNAVDEKKKEVDDYFILQNKLKVYEDKLRSIDP